jgi:tetratricopeptide (TPR) repeat protein
MSAQRLLALAPLLISVACSSVSPHTMAADHEQRGEWELALRNYIKILDKDPDDQRALKGYRRCADAYVAERAELVHGALANGEFVAALQLADDTVELVPDHPDAPPLLEEAAQRTQDAAIKASRADRYEQAVQLTEALGVYAPEAIPGIGDELAKLRGRWLKHTVSTAEVAERDGRSATAMLMWAKAHELSGNPDHLERSRTQRQKAVEAEQWRVQVVLQTPELSRYLERQVWPEGMAVALVANPTPGAVVARARLAPATCRTETQDFQKTVRVQVGTREVPNAQYQREASEVQQAQDLVWGAERELARARRDRDHAWRVAQGQPQGSSAWVEYDQANRRVRDAERDLGWREDQLLRERRDLASYQPYTLEPIYNDLPYTVNRVARRCTGRFEMSLGTTDPVFYEVKAGVEDETHPRLPSLGLAEDPLQLTPDAELAAQIAQQAAQLVEQGLQDGFVAHRQGVLARAQSAEDRLVKLEAGLRYALLAPEALTPDVLRTLQDGSGVDNIAHLIVRR